MTRIVRGKQFIAIDYQGNEHDKFRLKQVNGYWFAVVDWLGQNKTLYCTLKQTDSKSLIDVKNIK